MASRFTIFKGSDNQFYFKLTAANGEPVLASEAYTSKQGCQVGISSVKDNAAIDTRYEKKISTSRKYYFVLKTGNGEIIGKSELYESTSGRDNGIALVKRVAPRAPVEDIA